MMKKTTGCGSCTMGTPTLLLLVLIAFANVVTAQRGAAQPGMPAAGGAEPAAAGGVFDVTKYGAVADAKTDMSQALVKAFGEACASTTPATIVIPTGTFLCGQTNLKAPCKAPSITIQVLGTVKAPSDIAGDTWFLFDNINNLNIVGGGMFDGLGPTCYKTKKSVAVMGRASLINILNTNIGTGDDCISIGDGVSDLTVQNVTCGPGHGIAVGSLGRYPNEQPVKGIHVKNCTLTNTLEGLRIKSWPDMETGAASDIHFEDIIMNNVSFPIIIDQVYCPWNTCKSTVSVMPANMCLL
ncbi:Exopolygalacturonase (Fragment) [Linum perenne]